MNKASFRAVAFMYHDIIDDFSKSGFQSPGAESWKHSNADFNRDLEIILKNQSLIRLVTDIDMNQKGDYIFLTFDDGGKSALETARLLNEKNIKAHFFIVTSLIDTPQFLSKSAIKEIHQQGHIIGSHSHTHPNYFPALSFEQMREEWHSSVSILSDILGCSVDTASIPNGFRCSNTTDSAVQVGIKYFFTSDYRVRPWWINDTLCFGRIGVQNTTPPVKIERYSNFKDIARDRAYLQFKQIVKWAIWPIYKKIRLSYDKSAFLE